MDYNNLPISLLKQDEIIDQANKLNLLPVNNQLNIQKFIKSLNNLQPKNLTPAFTALVYFSKSPQVQIQNKYKLSDFDSLNRNILSQFYTIYSLENTVNLLNTSLLIRILAYSNYIIPEDIDVVLNPDFFYWYSLDDETLNKEAFNKCLIGLSRSQIIKKILKPQLSSEPFPYYYPNMLPVEQMFQNLKNYRPIVNSHKYKLNNYYPPNQQGQPIFEPNYEPKFRNKYVWTNSSEDLYKLFDGITNHFTEDARMQATRIDKPCSPKRLWQFNAQYIKQTATNKNVTYRDIIWDEVKEATQFKPSWFKFIVETIFSQGIGLTNQNNLIDSSYKNKKILDFSAGWGDRLITAISMQMSYLGFDPNTELKSGHDQIISKFGSINLQNTYRIRYEPFETAYLSQNDFDLVLTSPPFFNFEIYSDQETQSLNRYKDYNAWLNNFLFTSILKSWTALKPSGYLAIYIADNYNHQPIKPMNDFIRCLPNSKFEGVLGISGQSNKKFPVWVWKKMLNTTCCRRRDFSFSGINLTNLENVLNPTMVISQYTLGKRTFNVFRDDILIGGTKQRFIFKVLENIPCREFIYAGPNTGYAQVALSYTGNLMNKNITLFLNKLGDRTAITNLASQYNPKIIEKPKKLKDIQADSIKYNNHNQNSCLLPFGLYHKDYIQILYEQLHKVIDPNIQPQRIWLVVGSGMILQALYKLFPNSYFNIVRVGKWIPDEILDLSRTTKFDITTKYKFWEPTITLPPYPSVASYDAKLWEFVINYGQDGDYIWNVAKDV